MYIICKNIQNIQSKVLTYYSINLGSEINFYLDAIPAIMLIKVRIFINNWKPTIMLVLPLVFTNLLGLYLFLNDLYLWTCQVVPLFNYVILKYSLSATRWHKNQKINRNRLLELLPCSLHAYKPITILISTWKAQSKSTDSKIQPNPHSLIPSHWLRR